MKIGAGGIGFDVAEYLLHHRGVDRFADDLSNTDFWNEWGVDPSNRDRGGLSVAQHHTPERKMFLLQRKETKLGAGLGKTTGWIHRATLSNSGAVEMVKGVKYDRIDEDGNLHITTKEGSRILEVDNIVLCAGQVSKDHLAQEARNTPLADKLFTIGGAQEAGELDAKRAIDMGTRLAVSIHEDSVIPGNHIFKASVGTEEKMYQLWRRWM